MSTFKNRFFFLFLSLFSLSLFFFTFFTLKIVNNNLETPAHIINSVLLLAVVVLVIFLILAWVLISLFTKGAIATTRLIEDLGSAPVDLTKRIPVIEGGDLEKLAFSVNQFIEKISAVAITTRRDIYETRTIGKGLILQMEENSSIISSISMRIKDAVEQITSQVKTVHDVESYANTQKSATLKMTSGVRDILKNIEKLAQIVENQSSAIEQISATIEELSANVNNIATVSQNADHSSEQLFSFAKQGKESLESTDTSISAMLEAVDIVREFANIIMSIASQTNLLAMNAAIEAAHAGDAGKGFAVVAEEIRKLSDRSNQEANKVKGLLLDITVYTDKVREQLQKTKSGFEGVVNESQNVSHIVSQISTALEEQTNGNVEMVKAITSIQETTTILKESSQSINISTKAINSQVDQVVQLISQTEQSVNSMSEISSAVATTVEEVGANTYTLDASRNNMINLLADVNEKIEKLAKGIATFRVGERLELENSRPATSKSQGLTAATPDLFIVWEPNYSVGVAEMDQEHKVLIKLINDLHAAMSNRKGKEVTLPIITGLYEYTSKHFGHEEILMRQNGYPGLDVQLEQHKIFVEKIKEFVDKAESGALGLNVNILSFLSDWLINHIVKLDKQYTKFLNEKGVC